MLTQQLCPQDVLMLIFENVEVLKYLKKNLEIIINVLVCSFRFIWIPMLCVYIHYEYFISFSAGINFRRQNGTLISRSPRWKG